MKTQASILDYVRENVDQDIWEIDQDEVKLRPEIRAQILDVVGSALDDFDIPESAIKGVFVYGSILTNQYNSKTDVDCRILLDKEAIEKAYPGITGDDMFDVMEDQLHGIPLGDTQHPLNCSIVLEGEQAELGRTEYDPVYDVLSNKIIQGPVLVDDTDPDEDFAAEREDVDLIMEYLDELLRDAKNKTIDYEVIKEAVGQVQDPRKLQRKLEEKLQGIQDDIEQLVVEYEAIKEDRTEEFEDQTIENPHKQPGNVRHKYLERYQYLDTLKKLKKILKDGVSSEEIPEVEKALRVAELRSQGLAFEWQPENVGPKYKGIIEYPGFHTTESFEIAAMYAIGRVHQSYTEEDENGVNYVTDYPVVASVDMAGFEPKIDYDAAEMVLSVMKAQLDSFLSELTDEDTDDEIAEKLRRYVEFGEFEQDLPNEPLDFLSQQTFAHFDNPLGYLVDLDNVGQVIREYQQTGKISDEILMKASDQFRYTEDVSEGRIRAVWYVTPVANAMLTYEDDEDKYAAEYPGFDIIDEDTAFGGNWSSSEQLVYEETPHEQADLPGIDQPERRVQYHGTTYKRLLQIAPELQLPEPPNPPYRG